MILICDDFTFDNKKLSTQGYITVNFDDDDALPSSIKCDMEAGEMNQYRTERNGFGIKYTDTLIFDIHIMKDYCDANEQNDLIFTSTEYDTLVAWLSSPQQNMWMNVEIGNDNVQKVKGYFSSIEPYSVDGKCYGARCTFTCNSPFSYTEKTYDKTISGVQNFLLNNESSDYYDYVYPTFVIEPTKNEEIFIHNLSDTEILDNGVFTVSSTQSTNISNLQSKITSYAQINNLTVSYVIDEQTKDIKQICNNTGILFYMTDMYGIKHKYVAYYTSTDQQYYICHGGFFYCKLLLALDITVDCKNLGIYDSIDRPVLFTDLGIQDEDEIYWLRLIHGNNSIRVMGNFKLTIKYLEPRKGMLI